MELLQSVVEYFLLPACATFLLLFGQSVHTEHVFGNAVMHDDAIDADYQICRKIP